MIMGHLYVFLVFCDVSGGWYLVFEFWDLEEVHTSNLSGKYVVFAQRMKYFMSIWCLKFLYHARLFSTMR